MEPDRRRRAHLAGSSFCRSQARRSPRPYICASAGLSPDHSRITHSRNRTALAGHSRTSGDVHLGSNGPYRSRRDTQGHATDTVRDREAPGSNPRPPTKIVFESTSSPALSGPRGSQGGHRFSWTWAAAAPSKWIADRRLNSLTALAQPIYQHAHGPRTVRQVSLKSKLGHVRETAGHTINLFSLARAV